jgi:hypothetical protein
LLGAESWNVPDREVKGSDHAASNSDEEMGDFTWYRCIFSPLERGYRGAVLSDVVLLGAWSFNPVWLEIFTILTKKWSPQFVEGFFSCVNL